MSNFLRRKVARALLRCGYDVHRIRPPLAYLETFMQRQRIDTILDVGANTGQFGWEMRRAGYDGRIISFEPLSGAHADLTLRARQDPLWTVAPRIALGSEEGEIAIHVSGFSPASSVLPICDWYREASPEVESVGTETVPCRRLDTVAPPYLKNGNRSLLKLDVQGYEKQVLDGATNVLQLFAGVYLELSLEPLYKG